MMMKMIVFNKLVDNARWPLQSLIRYCRPIGCHNEKISPNNNTMQCLWISPSTQ